MIHVGLVGEMGRLSGGWGERAEEGGGRPNDGKVKWICRWCPCVSCSTQPPTYLRGFGMTPRCIALVCSGRRLLADRRSLPFPWTLSLHRRWCPSASHRPVSFLFLLGPIVPEGGGGGLRGIFE